MRRRLRSGAASEVAKAGEEPETTPYALFSHDFFAVTRRRGGNNAAKALLRTIDGIAIYCEGAVPELRARFVAYCVDE